MYHFIASNSKEIAMLIIVLLGISISVSIMFYKYYKRVVELNKVSFFDPLTEMANKKFLEDKAAYTIFSQAKIEHANSSKDVVRFLFITLDNFETIESHLEKDLLIRSFAANLEDTVKPADQCFRLNESKFLVIGIMESDDCLALGDNIESFTKSIGLLNEITANIETSTFMWTDIAVNPKSFYDLLGITMYVG